MSQLWHSLVHLQMLLMLQVGGNDSCIYHVYPASAHGCTNELHAQLVQLSQRCLARRHCSVNADGTGLVTYTYSTNTDEIPDTGVCHCHM